MHYPHKSELCAELIDHIDSADLNMFSEESTLQTRGKVTCHNCHIWGNEKPIEFLEWEQDTPKIVWFVIRMSKGIWIFLLYRDYCCGNEVS